VGEQGRDYYLKSLSSARRGGNLAVSDGRSGPRESKLNRTDGFAKEGKRKKRKEKGEDQFCSEVVGERTEISGPEVVGGALRKQRMCLC